MTNMENEIVKSLNKFYLDNKINAWAHRLKQYKYAGDQLIDLISDSLDHDYYLGIECKSINGFKYNRLNFKSHFSKSNDNSKAHQLERELYYCNRVGRRAFVVVELRMGLGHPRECFFIPMDDLFKQMKSGFKSIHVDDIRAYPNLPRSAGKYVINKKVWAKIVA